MPMTLSRRSRTYKFVFGQQEGRIEGFPDPKTNRISLGVFAGMFVFMAIMRPLASVLLLLMDAMLKLIGFLIDGTYVRGNILTGWEKVPIEPWPRVFGRRLSPWIVLGILVVAYQYSYVGTSDALQALAFCIGMVVMTHVAGQGPSATEVIAEAIGPQLDEKIRLSYYREPRFFPAVHLVD